LEQKRNDKENENKTRPETKPKTTSPNLGKSGRRVGFDHGTFSKVGGGNEKTASSPTKSGNGFHGKQKGICVKKNKTSEELGGSMA